MSLYFASTFSFTTSYFLSFDSIHSSTALITVHGHSANRNSMTGRLMYDGEAQNWQKQRKSSGSKSTRRAMLATAAVAFTAGSLLFLSSASPAGSPATQARTPEEPKFGRSNRQIKREYVPLLRQRQATGTSVPAGSGLPTATASSAGPAAPAATTGGAGSTITMSCVDALPSISFRHSTDSVSLHAATVRPSSTSTPMAVPGLPKKAISALVLRSAPLL